MRCLAQLGCLASVAVVVVGGCGGGGSGNLIAECEQSVCPCSEAGIRGAIAEGSGSFTFDCDGPTTVFTSREIVIETDVTLDGEAKLTVDANGTHRVFSVSRDVTAELNRLTVANGNQTEDNGGGIRNEGTLTLRESTVSGSNAGRATGCRTDDASQLCAEGGGIWNAGSLTLIDSTVSGCSGHFGGVYWSQPTH